MSYDNDYSRTMHLANYKYIHTLYIKATALKFFIGFILYYILAHIILKCLYQPYNHHRESTTAPPSRT